MYRLGFAMRPQLNIDTLCGLETAMEGVRGESETP
jgi:hypothetical protein